MGTRSWIKQRYNKMSITEALQSAKEGLTAMATRLKTYVREAEAKRKKILLSKDPADNSNLPEQQLANITKTHIPQ